MRKNSGELAATCLTLDSSVIVAALGKDEEKRAQCRVLLDEVVKGDVIAYQPCLVLPEVASAIRRRTGSSDSARQALNLLIQDGVGFRFMELNMDRAREAARLAIDTGVRGMDAIFVQIAKEFDSTLVTLDIDMSSKVTGVVQVMKI